MVQGGKGAKVRRRVTRDQPETCFMRLQIGEQDEAKKESCSETG